ncbi:MAG: hypothetical protein JST22_20890 [Bacteroidetes bacterium]|nr:hypothetical protein [Bacteroidota bacterium]
MNLVTGIPISLTLLFGLCSPLSAQWRPIQGTARTNFVILSVDGRYIYAGTQIGEMRRTSDNGQTWDVKNKGLPDSSIFITLYNEPGLLLLGTGRGAFRSTDNGDSWYAVGAEFAAGHVVHRFERLGSNLYMAADSGLAQSTDNGATWARSENGLLPVRSFQTVAKYGGKLLCAIRLHGIYASVDSGKAWSPYSDGMPPRTVYSIASGSDFVLASIVTGGAYRSQGTDANWINIADKFPQYVRYLSNFSVYQNSIVFAASDYGFLASYDSAQTWRLDNDGLNASRSVMVNDLYLYNGELFIATALDGCYRRPLSELLTPPSGVEDATAGAAATRLGQSIPNPTSGEVIIPYSLAASGHVTIALYNSLLQQVATVVDGEEPSGPHTARLDASALPPGAYYYRLHAGTVNLTRQMVIVR